MLSYKSCTLWAYHRLWQLLTYRDRVGFIDLELSRFILVAMHPAREEAEEGP